MSKPLIYLAGPITGLSYGGAVDWREAAVADLAPEIVALSPMRGKQYLAQQPTIGDAYNEYPLSTQAAITARDRFDVQRCDLVLFNMLGAPKASIGTCIELGWADAFRKPAVLVIEETGNIHDHSMVRQVCGWRASSIEQGLAIARAVLLP